MSLTKSYSDAGGLLTLDVDTAWLVEQVDDRIDALIPAPPSGLFTKNYNDGANTLTLDVNVGALDARYVNATGDLMAGPLQVMFGSATDWMPAGTTFGVKASINSVAGATPMAVYGYAQAGLGNGDVAYGGYFTSHADRALSATGTTSFGVYATTEGGDTRWAGYFNGNVNVTGSFFAGSKSYRIDHPQDPLNKDIVHGVVETNGHGKLYCVTVEMNGAVGPMTINLDEALNMTSGTLGLIAQQLKVCGVYSTGAARVSAAVALTNEVGEIYDELTMESETPGDMSIVNVAHLRAARRPIH